MPHDDDPLEQQQWLCENSLPLVFETYDDAIKHKIKHPIVVLLDCGDDVGGRLARAWLGDEAVDDALEEFTATGETAVYARPLAYSDAKRDISAIFSYLQPLFDEPAPTDGVLVISVTAGGASALTAPFDARPEAGETDNEFDENDDEFDDATFDDEHDADD